MQIQFERTGGFANIRFAGNFDLDSMPEEIASQLKQLLEEVDFPSLPEQLPGNPAIPDQFHYSITVTTQSWQHTVITSDQAAPRIASPAFAKAHRAVALPGQEKSTITISFAESLRFKEYVLPNLARLTTADTAGLQQHLGKYLQRGGTPDALKYPDTPLLRTLYDDVLDCEIATRYHIHSGCNRKPNMKLLPRVYRDETDLAKMCTLLQRGCAAQADAYYIHPGELNLCLFQWLDGHDPWQHIYLWEDHADSEQLLGWAILSTPWSAFDVFVQPDLWNSTWAAGVNAWVEEKSVGKAGEQGYRHIWRMNVAETDSFLREHLCAHGFQEVPEYMMLSLACTLDRELPEPVLPDGYTVRQVGETDTADRAAAQHAAFSN